jgi:hypothetical protein
MDCPGDVEEGQRVHAAEDREGCVRPATDAAPDAFGGDAVPRPRTDTDRLAIPDPDDLMVFQFQDGVVSLNVG